MRLTPRLLGALNRVFDKDPEPFVAMKVAYSGGMTWSVADGMLTTVVVGGPGVGLRFDLSQYTLRTLSGAIAGSAGYQVNFLSADAADLDARVLLDASGDTATTGGDQLLAFSSLLWALLETFARGLQDAAAQVGEMLRQMSTNTASGPWLEELGSYYKVPRNPGEADGNYGPRIIAETLRPVSNGIAIELAIEDYTGQPCKVEDVTIYRGVSPLYDGSINFDGAHNYDAPGVPTYGLFDVEVAYDLLSGAEPTAFLAQVQAVVNKIRAGGRFLRALVLSGAGSGLVDTLAAPTDDADTASFAGVTDFSDTMSAPDDSATMMPAASLTDMSESFAGPADAADGTIYALILTSGGDALTTDGGDPILATVGPLFG
jgi:hypothetical protein